jgi:hypothetical protein
MLIAVIAGAVLLGPSVPAIVVSSVIYLVAKGVHDAG